MESAFSTRSGRTLEASRRLPDDLLQRHPEIDWAAIAAAGNIYRHEYDAVDEALLWRTVHHSLGQLWDVCIEELRRRARDAGASIP